MQTLYGPQARYLTPEDMAAAVDAYFFFDCEKIKVDNIREPVPLITITGLTIYLGFESRTSLVYYEQEKPEFTWVIRRARLFVEYNYEKMLQIGNYKAAMFALNQMGWKNSFEIDHGNKDGKAFRSINSGMSNKEASQAYAQLVKDK
jgi:hypothetical protein